MDLDANALLASLLVGSIGLVAFIYGKRQSRPPQLVVGLVLMIYPYFVSNVLVMLGIAFVLLAGMWLAIRRGM